MLKGKLNSLNLYKLENINNRTKCQVNVDWTIKKLIFIDTENLSNLSDHL